MAFFVLFLSSKVMNFFYFFSVFCLVRLCQIYIWRFVGVKSEKYKTKS